MITKGEITETAFYLFAEIGFHETSMENIADALGLKKQSLYSHFRSKNELILTVFREQEEKIKSEMDRLISQHCQQPVGALLKFFFINISIIMSHRERLLFWKRIPLYTLDDELRASLMQAFWEFQEGFRRDLSEVLCERSAYFRNPDHLNAFSVHFMVTLQGYMDMMLMTGYSNETAELIWNSFWNGVSNDIEHDVS